MKQCTRCHEQKSLGDFAGGGKHAWCKPCYNSYCREKRQAETDEQRESRKRARNAKIKENQKHVRSLERAAYRKRRELNPEERANYYWQRHLKHDYNLTVEQWYQMLDAQGGVCGICKKPPVAGQRRFAVDHDHTCCPGFGSCGKCIRGLLCSYCNTKIEFAVTNIDEILKWLNN